MNIKAWLIGNDFRIIDPCLSCKYYSLLICSCVLMVDLDFDNVRPEVQEAFKEVVRSGNFICKNFKEDIKNESI